MVQRKLTRLDNWRSRLAAELDMQRTIPFQWGKNDCVLGLARRVVIALTGKDLVPHSFAPRYRSERGAIKALKDLGFTDLQAAVGSFLPAVHPDKADIGDLALVPSEGLLGNALGVFEEGTILVLTESGHGRVPREEAILAFKV